MRREGVKYLDLHDDRCQRTPSYVNPYLIQPSLSPHSDCNHGTTIHKPRTKICTPVFLVIITIASVMFALAAPISVISVLFLKDKIPKVFT